MRKNHSFFIFLVGFFLVSQLGFGSNTPCITAKSNTKIRQLYHSLTPSLKSDISKRAAFMSAYWLNQPYLLGALGEGLNAQFDSSPLYRTDGFDCETFVTTVIALTLSTNLANFQTCINHLRYKKGQIGFIHRHHFTSLDWNIHNQQQGFIRDITHTIHDPKGQSIAQSAKATIDKANWYRHLTLASIKLSGASENLKQTRLNTLKKLGQRFTPKIAQILYIPFTKLFNRQGQPNYYYFNQIPNGTIIEIIRPNWNLQKEIGTHLNVSHLGFVFRLGDRLIFREASSIHHKVVDIDFIAYLQDKLASPTIKGINLQQIQNPEKSAICH
ncbi:MAG: hypothetical protein CMF38_08355 [Legionellaceae bacterium]|nr:hypothetical protein [Legionellaceae bacterium]HAF87088.1 DUF1460 domain-containing protein [Legionellales bacterium]HCA88861.1 DUF1460 domain-containing protein [Legionellales bacterium]|tara:strand:- start:1973 stop:2956 length:984 start_codon:yes stop_codon:yes gene_type:complete